MKRFINNFFPYPISTVYIIIGFVLSFLAFFNGLSLHNQLWNYLEEENDYKYRSKTVVDISLRDMSTTVQDILHQGHTNIKVQMFHAYFDHYKNYAPTSIYMEQNEPEMLQVLKGRLPTKADLKAGKPIIVIGRGMQGATYTKDGKSYVDIFGEAYLVLGIVGTKSSDVQDYVKLTYYDCLGAEFKKFLQEERSYTVTFESNEVSTIQSFKEMKEKYEDKKTIEMTVSNSEIFTGAGNAVSNQRNYYYMISIFCIVNCAIVSEFWVMQRKKELAIRKAMGWGNFQILEMLYKDMLKIAAVAYMLCGILQMCINAILKHTINVMTEISVVNVAITVFFILAMCFVQVAIPMSKLIRMTPVQAIAGKGEV